MPPASTAKADKILVTNGSALRAKYGAKGFALVNKAIKELIGADKKRGLTTVLVDLASAEQMAGYGGLAVTAATDPKPNKNAIDAIFDHDQPAYLMIVGAPDIVAHQDLANPAYSPMGDADQTIPSDLPYACSHPYSTDPADFLGPTRVVGRLPDVTNRGDASYLVALLANAANYSQQPASAYMNPLGISAAVWKTSTTLSLRALFGAKSTPYTSPRSGPNWKPDQMARLSHFINCHGAPATPTFFGQKEDNYPPAHEALVVASNAVAGTVVAAECCYGAELYDPALPSAGGQVGICNTYLERSAYAFFGSSTIAYGPSDANGEADLICQDFFKHLLTGASVGRAALQARQDYVSRHSPLGPLDLKTVAQFNLLADPALTPVAAPSAERTVAKAGGVRALAALASNARTPSYDASRAVRRANLAAAGTLLASQAAIEPSSRSAAPSDIEALLRKAIEQSGGKLAGAVVSFDVARARGSVQTKASRALLAAVPTVPVSKVHLAIGRLSEQARGANGVPGLVAIVAREVDGSLIVRELFSR